MEWDDQIHKQVNNKKKQSNKRSEEESVKVNGEFSWCLTLHTIGKSSLNMKVG